MDDLAALASALRRMQRLTGLPVVFGGLVAARGDVRISETFGTTTGVLRGLLVTAGTGLGGRVAATGRPGAVDDYAADRRISHEYDRPVVIEGLRAIAAVPVPVNGRVSAVLYGATREPLPLDERALDGAMKAARNLGVQLAIHREVARRLATVETAAALRAAREQPSAPAWEEVRSAHAELRAIAQDITDPLVRQRLQDVCDRLARSGGRPGRRVNLAPREVDVLALVAIGCTNAEAGQRLGLLPETVKAYLRSATRKLGSHGRMATVAAARAEGLLP